MAHSVYLSFAHGDCEPAQQILRGLERTGLRCWHPARDVRPGEEWGSALRQALESSRVILVLESRESQRSQFVLSDLLTARHRGIPVVEVAIEKVLEAELDKKEL